jgi:hypothetical protein
MNPSRSDIIAVLLTPENLMRVAPTHDCVLWLVSRLTMHHSAVSDTL